MQTRSADCNAAFITIVIPRCPPYGSSNGNGNGIASGKANLRVKLSAIPSSMWDDFKRRTVP